MKNLFLIALLVIGTMVNAQKKVLPEEVSTSLTEKYPNAIDIKFKVKKQNYHTKFKNDSNPTAVVFKPNGDWIETKTTLKESSLPSKVMAALTKKYNDGTITGSVFYENCLGEEYYIVNILTGKATYLIEIDTNGEILKNEKTELPKAPSSNN